MLCLWPRPSGHLGTRPVFHPYRRLDLGGLALEAAGFGGFRPGLGGEKGRGSRGRLAGDARVGVHGGVRHDSGGETDQRSDSGGWMDQRSCSGGEVDPRSRGI